MTDENKNMDKMNLYKKETITDLNIGEIDVCTPINITGERDLNRDVFYIGSSQIMTPQGPMPISTEITGAKTLEEAIDGFIPAIEAHVAALIEQAKQQAIDNRNRIITPDEATMAPNLTMVKK